MVATGLVSVGAAPGAGILGLLVASEVYARMHTGRGRCSGGLATMYLRSNICAKNMFGRYIVARVPITLMGFQCERCDYQWIPRDIEQEPKVCPSCKSPYWNRPRKKASATTYEAFRDAVRSALEQERRPLTWTEIRTVAKLPQKFPNNRWVRDLERAISLTRPRSEWHNPLDVT